MSAIAWRFGLVGGARRLLDRLEAERRRVLVKRRDVAIGVLAQRHAAFALAPAMVLSSTSVKFMTWRICQPPTYFSARRSTSTQTKVRKLPMWPRA